MSPLLRALPYFDVHSSIVGAGVHERAYPFQVVVWISITPIEQFELPMKAPRFPAILDTGLNDTLAISPVHLRSWAGLQWSALPAEGVNRYYGSIPIPARRAYLWLHPNQFGWRDEVDPLIPAYRLELSLGITVYGNGEQMGTDARTRELLAPRLPLLGLRALSENKCQLRLDCARRLLFLDVPDSD